MSPVKRPASAAPEGELEALLLMQKKNRPTPSGGVFTLEAARPEHYRPIR
jgi:hypothetical protein